MPDGRATTQGAHAFRDRRYASTRLEAGFAIRYTGPVQKNVADVLGITQPNVSRQVHAEQDGDVAKFYEIVSRAVVHGHADAGHLIAGAMHVAEEAAVSLGLDEVARRLCVALSQETLFQATEDQAEYRVASALGCLAHDPTDSELAELRAALEAHDDALRREMGREVDSIVWNRALRRLMSWRREA